MVLADCVLLAAADDDDDDDDDLAYLDDTTNHLTDAPMLAALTAVTSPTPPGGETTIMTLFCVVFADCNIVLDSGNRLVEE